jgi:branched-chain amino acid transport system substrate-binding protein
VLTAACNEVVPEDALSRDGEVILAGFMAPVRGRFESHGTPLRQGATLALEEIEARTQGIPSADSGRVRHLAMLVCHDSPDDLNTLQRPADVARHLVQLGVPAVIGPSKIPSGVTSVIIDILSAGGVLTLSPSATHVDIPSFEQNGLFWRTVPSDWWQAEAWRGLGLLVAADLWKRGVVPDTRSPKTVIVARSDDYGDSLSKSFTDNVFPKGAPPPPGWPYELDAPVDWSAIAREIVHAEPEVVFAFSTNEFVTELLPRIEEGLDPAQTRPYYLLLDGTRVRELLDVIKENPALGPRILGTAPGLRTSPLFAGFRDRFERAFGQEPGNLADAAYDATYLLAYAVANAKREYPTGRDLAPAMRAMSCRERTVVASSPDGLADSLRAAAQDDCVNFEGASGPLDFDNATGEARNHYAVWCAGPDSSAKLGFRNVVGSGGLPVHYDFQARNIVNMPAAVPFCPATP